MVHASKSLTYGKGTKRIIHVAEVVDGVSVSEDTRYNSLLYRYRKQIPVYEYVQKKNVSRGTKKRSDEFVIGD